MTDLIARMTVAREHNIALIEGGYPVPGTEPMPHYYLIECKCGWRSKTYHGEGAARELAERHIFVKLNEIAITPGGANRAPAR